MISGTVMAGIAGGVENGCVAEIYGNFFTVADFQKDIIGHRYAQPVEVRVSATPN